VGAPFGYLVVLEGGCPPRPALGAGLIALGLGVAPRPANVGPKLVLGPVFAAPELLVLLAATPPPVPDRPVPPVLPP
jgi:hypothetical protein